MFCLYPHQTAYVVPARAVVAVPEGVPPARAVLAGTVETAVNALWDAAPLIGDRMTVVGAGMVGCCVAALLARFPGASVAAGRRRRGPGRGRRRRSASSSPRRPTRPAGRTWSCTPARPRPACSARLDLLAREGTVVELSWYGEREVTLSLGGWFHSGRLSIRSSQVGTVPPARRASRTSADRLALALDLLRDPVFDVLLTGESPFDDLPDVLAAHWPPAHVRR